MKQILRAIGLMSGTSMDGIDVALIETDGENHVEAIAHASFPFDASFTKRIEGAITDSKLILRRGERPGRLSDVEQEITVRHIGAVSNFLLQNEMESSSIDIIGFHGQTVLHRPDRGFTVQLGDGDVMAHSTGIDVIYDMRAKDMRNGGQGAPLVPVYHQALAQQLKPAMRKGGIGFVNIGGISNATLIFEKQDPVAFDCGPGNALIDQWIKAEASLPYDDGGKIASEGKADDATIAKYMKLPFFKLKGPKSLDRGDFTLKHMKGKSLEDGAATLAKLTAVAIAKSILNLEKPPKTMVVSGGGARNAEILRYLQDEVGKPIKVVTADSLGFNGDMMEAEAWAYLAVRSLKRLPLTFPTTTGCKKAVTGGVKARAVGEPL